jgi:hypothetical protein
MTTPLTTALVADAQAGRWITHPTGQFQLDLILATRHVQS